VADGADSTKTHSKTVSVTVLASGGVPTANFSVATAGLVASFTDASTDAGGTISARAWSFGDGGTSTATNPSHAYASAGTYTVTETVTDGVSVLSSVKSLAVTVAASQQLVLNDGFESGVLSPWVATGAAVKVCSASSCTGVTPPAGTYALLLGGTGSTKTATVAQAVAVPAAATKATLTFNLRIGTNEAAGAAVYDTFKVQVVSGTTTTTLATYSNKDAAAGYVARSFDLTPYKGKSIKVQFAESEDSSLASSFTLDDVRVTAQ
jgi:PKD repeat protein